MWEGRYRRQPPSGKQGRGTATQTGTVHVQRRTAQPTSSSAIFAALSKRV